MSDEVQKWFPLMLLEDYSVKDGCGTIRAMRKAGSPYVPVCIPWELIAPHEEQAQRNHSQSLQRLADRGGLSADEAVAILENRQWREIPIVEANETLCRLMANRDAASAKAETAVIDAALELTQGELDRSNVRDQFISRNSRLATAVAALLSLRARAPAP